MPEKNISLTSLEGIEAVFKARKVERENRIKFSKPYEVITDSLPSLKSPKEIFHSTWLFAQETEHNPIKILDSNNELVLGIFPSSDQDYGGRVKIDDLAVLSALIGILEDLVKNKRINILYEKIEITAHSLMKKMGLKSFSSKDYQEIENALYRLRQTEYRGLLVGKNGFEDEFHFLDHFAPKREIYKSKRKLKKFVIVIGESIAHSIMNAPDKPLLQLGKGFIRLKGGFKKKLWYLIVGRIGKGDVWFSKEDLKKELESSEMLDWRFHEKIKRALKTMPWAIDDREWKEKSVYRFFQKHNSQLELTL